MHKFYTQNCVNGTGARYLILGLTLYAGLPELKKPEVQVKLNVPATVDPPTTTVPGPKIRTRRFSGTMLGERRSQLPRSSSACSNVSFVSR
jgi:hypothetical protein